MSGNLTDEQLDYLYSGFSPSLLHRACEQAKRVNALEAELARLKAPAPEGRPERDKTLVIHNAGREVTDGMGICRLEGSGVPITHGAWVSLEDHKQLIAEYEKLDAYCTAKEAELSQWRGLAEHHVDAALERRGRGEA